MSEKRQLVLWPRAEEDKTVWEDARSRGASADEGSEPESDAYYYQADSSKLHSSCSTEKREKSRFPNSPIPNILKNLIFITEYYCYFIFKPSIEAVVYT